jgi:hypothetical protein
VARRSDDPDINRRRIEDQQRYQWRLGGGITRLERTMGISQWSASRSTRRR